MYLHTKFGAPSCKNEFAGVWTLLGLACDWDEFGQKNTLLDLAYLFFKRGTIIREMRRPGWVVHRNQLCHELLIGPGSDKLACDWLVTSLI